MKHAFVVSFVSAIGGWLLAIAERPNGVAWLSLVAHLPLIVATASTRTWGHAALAGLCWGLGRYVPMARDVSAWALLPHVQFFGLAAYVLVVQSAIAVVVRALQRLPHSVVRAFCIAGALLSWEVLDARLPMSGTTLSLARVWVDAPPFARRVVAFVMQHFGIHSIGLLTLCVQSFAGVALLRRRAAFLLPAVAILGAAWALGISRRSVPLASKPLRVATIAGERSLLHDVAVSDALARAKREGARVVLFAEGFEEVFPGETASFEAKWLSRATATDLVLVVPFLDRDKPGNRLIVAEPSTPKALRYTKRHLVPGEAYPPGEGTLVLFDVDGVRIGTLICHDDNYTDVTHAYGKAGAQILLAPAFEGPMNTGAIHFSNARLRTLEHPVSLVRASTRGVSAIVGPNAEVAATLVDNGSGVAMLVGDVPVPNRQ